MEWAQKQKVEYFKILRMEIELFEFEGIFFFILIYKVKKQM